MRHQFLLAATVTLALIGTAGRGQERNEDECLRLHPSIQSPVDMVTCTSDISGSKRVLDDAFATLRARVPAEYRPDLDKTQHAWIVHRDAQCQWEAGGNQGSTGHSSSIIACTADMNRKRANYLQDDLKDRW